MFVHAGHDREEVNRNALVADNSCCMCACVCVHVACIYVGVGMP